MTSGARRVAFWLVTMVLAGLVVIEARRVLEQRDTLARRRGVPQVLDPLLNHSFAPGVDEDCVDVTNIYDIDARGCRFVTNAHGFKSSHAVTMPKPPGTWRVFVVGDSFVEGLCDGRFPMPGVLEKSLETAPALRGSRIEVVNTGVSGASALTYELLVRERIAKLAPDVVVIAVDMTDPYDDTVLGTVAVYAPDGTLLKLSPTGSPRRYSELSPGDMFGWTRVDGIDPDDPTPWTTRRHDIEATMGRVTRALRAAREAGARVVLTAVPRREHFLPEENRARMSHRPMERVKEEADRNRAPYFDTFGALKADLAGRDHRSLYLYPDDHFNLAGNEAWGRALAGFFVTNAATLLPAEGTPR